jgi:hypothetical protein
MTNNLPNEIKAIVAKRSRSKGSNYERDVAKKIAKHFGWNWNDCFIRTSLSSYAQPQGDLRPINDMRNLWIGAKLGPLECKNRASWSFDQLFKTPEKSELYRYWKKSNDDTNSDNTVLVFTKNAVSDFVMIRDGILDINQAGFTYLSIWGDKEHLNILKLTDFLNTLWPKN